MHCCSQYTRTPMFCCLLGCENRWSLPNTPPGYWALCTLLSCDSAPFISCGNFPSGVRQGPAIDYNLSGPCPRGPCGAGGLLDLPLVPMAGRGQLVPPPLAGRAVAGFLILSPSPHFYLQEARDKKTTQQHDAGTGGSAPIGIGGCKPQGPRVVDRRAHRLFVRTTADSRGGGGGVVLLEHEACVQMLALFRNSHAPKRILM